jgi:hypothetical protein
MPQPGPGATPRSRAPSPDRRGPGPGQLLTGSSTSGRPVPARRGASSSAALAVIGESVAACRRRRISTTRGLAIRPRSPGSARRAPATGCPTDRRARELLDRRQRGTSFAPSVASRSCSLARSAFASAMRACRRARAPFRRRAPGVYRLAVGPIPAAPAPPRAPRRRLSDPFARFGPRAVPVGVDRGVRGRRAGRSGSSDVGVALLGLARHRLLADRDELRRTPAHVEQHRGGPAEPCGGRLRPRPQVAQRVGRAALEW